MPAGVVLVAAGAGSRVGAAANKVLLPMGDVPVLVWSVRAALDVPDVHRLVLVVRPGEEVEVEAAVAPHLGDREVLLVPGGSTRHESEWHGVRALAPAADQGELDVLVVHDAARPLAGAELFAATIDAAREHGGAVPVLALPALVTSSLQRASRDLVGAQTPQAFRAQALVDAHRRAAEEGFEGTDTASVVERYGTARVVAVPGSPTNLKITFPDDVGAAVRLATDR